MNSEDDVESPPGTVEIPEAPKPGGLDPDELEPDAQAIADAERDAEEMVPEIPTAPEPEDADSAAVGLFWKLVVVFNVAVFGIAVGPMIGYFRGNWDLGLQLFAVGLLAFAYGLVRYYRFREGRATDGSGDEEAT